MERLWSHLQARLRSGAVDGVVGRLRPAAWRGIGPGVLHFVNNVVSVQQLQMGVFLMARECCNQSNKGRLPEKRITFILLSGGALAGAGFTLGNVLGTLINYLLDSWVTGSIGYLSGFTLSYAACYLIGILVGQKILSWRENEEEKSPSSEE